MSVSHRDSRLKWGFPTPLLSPTNFPQGTIMGPILWNTFINDLTPDADFVKYADDTTIYTAVSSADALVSNATAQSHCITT